MKKLLIAALLLSSCLGSPAFADQVVKPATGSNFNTCTTLVSTTDITCVQLKTAAGTLIDPATSGNQTTANGSLATIATNTTGAATAANQTTANTSLSTIATNTTGASTAANQATANTSLSTIATNTTGATNFLNDRTGTGLAGSATFTGTSQDVGVAAGASTRFGYFNAFFFTDQAGTAYVECSNDNATFYVCATGLLTVSAPLILQVPVMTRYHRSKVVNGSTAETLLWVNVAYTGG